MDAISGRWRLLYTSAFTPGGGLGGSRPSLPLLALPVALGPVYQRIQPRRKRLDNIVELLPALPGLPPATITLGCAPPAAAAPAPSTATSPLAPLAPLFTFFLPPIAIFTPPWDAPPLAHPRPRSHDLSFDAPGTVRIASTSAALRLRGGRKLGLPNTLKLPQLPEGLSLPSSTFEVGRWLVAITAVTVARRLSAPFPPFPVPALCNLETDCPFPP